jgi:flagellar hook-associated protein 2
MGSSTTPLSSSAPSSSAQSAIAGITPITLNGISQYASDFQTILNRSVQIATIPIEQMQNQQSLIESQISSATGLSTAVSAVAADLTNLANLGSSQALTANSSDSSVVSAQVTGATANTSYAITNVTSVASAASESSLNSYADATTTPVSTTGSMQLTVGSNTYAINLTSGNNNLTGLENAINNLDAGVTAQILTTSNGDYLSVSADSPGATTLQLADDPTGADTQWLTDQNQGSNTTFDLNGVPISTPQTTINNVVPGMTFTINGTTSAGQTVNVSLSSDVSQVSSALQQFVTDYNSLNQEIGSVSGTGDALQGDSVIWQLKQSMLQLASYNIPGNSGINSLSSLGVTFDQTGTASFDSSALSSLSSSQTSAVFSLLGSATTGLGAIANQFSAISAPSTGAIASEISAWNTQNTTLTTNISNATAQVNEMQTLLSQQLEAADAQVDELQTQQSLLNSSIQSLNYTTYGTQINQQKS